MPWGAKTKWKTCSACKEYKEAKDFSVERANGSGLRSDCKECRRLYMQSKRQDKLETRALSGDKDISFCYCGNYYKDNIPYNTAYVRKLIKYDKCFQCRRKK